MSGLRSPFVSRLSTLSLAGALVAAPAVLGLAAPARIPSSATGLVPAALVGAPPPMQQALQQAVTTLPPGNTEIVIQNLLTSQTATARVVVRRPDGTPVLDTTVGPIPPNAARTLDLGAEAGLPTGWLTAVVESPTPLGVVARTAWPMAPGPRARPDEPGPDMVAIANAAAPDLDVVVPVVVKEHRGATSVVAVHNTDAARPAAVDARVAPLEGGAPVWQGHYDLAPGGAAALDFGGPAFGSLPEGFAGVLRLTADAPIAVHAVHGADTLSASGMAAAAHPGFGTAAAAARWHTMFRSPFPNAYGAGVNGSSFVVHNPGAIAATVDVAYTGAVDTGCAGAVFQHPTLTVAPGATVEVSQRADGGAGLPTRCWGIAAVRASAPVVAMIFEIGPVDDTRYLYAYPALSPADHAARLGSRLRDPDASTVGRMGLSVFNPSPGPAGVTLELFDTAGTRLSNALCRNCSVHLEAGQIQSWNALVGDFPRGIDGTAVIASDVPIAAYGSEILAYGAAVYVASPAVARAGTYELPFVAHAAHVAAPTVGPPPATPPPAPTPPARPPAAPHQPAYAFGDAPAGAGAFGARGDSLGVAVDHARGVVYAADAANHRIQAFDARGPFRHAWGARGTAPGQLVAPGDVAVAADGTVYVMDTENFRVQRFDPQGRFMGVWGGPGAAPGRFGAGRPVCEDRSCGPNGIAVAADGSVWVADTWNRRLQRFGPTGAVLGIIPLAAGGEGSEGTPTDVAVGPDGTIWTYVPYDSHLRRYAPDGTPRGRFPARDDGPDAFGFEWVTALTVADDGAVWVGGAGAGELARWDADGRRRIVRLAGSDGGWSKITALAPDAGGAVWAAEAGSQRLVRLDADGMQRAWLGGPRDGSGGPLPRWSDALDVAPDGTVVVVGSTIIPMVGDESEAPAWWRGDVAGRFDGQSTGGEAWEALAAAPDGTWFAAQGYTFSGQRYVAHLDRYGRVLGQRWLPSGTTGYAQDLAVAPDGTLAVLMYDSQRPYQRRILRLAPGGGLAATWVIPLDDPYAPQVTPRLAAAADGAVFVSTGSRVSRYGPDGTLEARWGAHGTGPGQMRAALDIAVGPDGTVYVADAGNDRVQRFGRDGALRSVWPAHPAAEVVDDDGDGWPDSVRIAGIAVADDGRVLVLDDRQRRVLVFAPPATGTPPGPAGLGHGSWRRSTFDNRWLADLPRTVEADAGLDLDLSHPAPGPGLPDDGRSMRLEQTVALPAGWHRVDIESRDGLRAWIGGQLVVDAGDGPAPRRTLWVRGETAQPWRFEVNSPGTLLSLRLAVRPQAEVRSVHLPWVGTR